jgi:hypothetical protein
VEAAPIEWCYVFDAKSFLLIIRAPTTFSPCRGTSGTTAARAIGRLALETIFSSVSDPQKLEHSELEHCAAVRPAETLPGRTAEARNDTRS